MSKSIRIATLTIALLLAACAKQSGESEPAMYTADTGAGTEPTDSVDLTEDTADTSADLPTEFGEVVASSASWSAGRTVAGDAIVWGNTTYGQDGSLSGPLAQITAGSYHLCGLVDDGSVVCAGRYEEGQISPPSGVRFQQISGGVFQTCGVTVDGDGVCWGEAYTEAPSEIVGEDVVEVAAGYAFACWINDVGELGCSTHDKSRITEVPPGVYSSMDASWWDACAVEVGGGVVCWDAGAVVTRPALPAPAVRVSVNLSHACALLQDGAISCWGDNSFGESDSPEGVFQQVAAGDYHTCALDVAGVVTCWGANGSGQCDVP